MNRTITTTTIKKSTTGDNITVILLSAGIGPRIKSNEPRSLIKIKNKFLLDHQIEALNTAFKNVEIIGVFGPYIERIIKKNHNNIRIVENQLYQTTNNSESLRLAINNTNNNKILFIHGDIYFTDKIFKEADFSKSFVILDANNDIEEKEVGVTINKNKISIMSYGLPKKWCQMCFLTGKELKILKSFFLKHDERDKKMLTFELLNKIIESGGSFTYHESPGSRIVEIDCIKDVSNEHINM